LSGAGGCRSVGGFREAAPHGRAADVGPPLRGGRRCRRRVALGRHSAAGRSASAAAPAAASESPPEASQGHGGTGRGGERGVRPPARQLMPSASRLLVGTRAA
jgi:hypothetical protein